MLSKNNDDYHVNRNIPETVLIMQGGGSLGAYECGVCKTLAKLDLKFDIVAGTSIGAINAAIITSGYSEEEGIRNSVKTLENFWMDLAEKITPFSFSFPFQPAFFSNKQRGEMAAATALYFGVSNAFTPLWISQGGGLPFYFYYYFFNSPFMYNTGKLKNTLYKYIDFTKFQIKEEEMEPPISKSHSSNQKIQGSKNSKKSANNTTFFPRLMLTATNIQTGQSALFDSKYVEIRIEHIMASAGYAIYGLPWTKIDDNYLWDGSFVHNTPLRSIMESTGRRKIVYISDVFPTRQQNLPKNMPETYHRIRDLLFQDKSIKEISKMSDIIQKHMSLLQQMHEVLMSGKIYNAKKNIENDKEINLKIDKIESEYFELISEDQGLLVENLIHVQRKENPETRFLFEDADFSVDTVRKLIKQGEEDAEIQIKKNKFENGSR